MTRTDSLHSPSSEPFGYAMVNYYDVPIPGFGRSFYHLVTDEAQYLTSLIGNTALDNANQAIGKA